MELPPPSGRERTDVFDLLSTTSRHPWVHMLDLGNYVASTPRMAFAASP
jgi:hypothetical protein